MTVTPHITEYLQNGCIHLVQIKLEGSNPQMHFGRAQQNPFTRNTKEFLYKKKSFSSK